jgi:hypothetical protein
MVTSTQTHTPLPPGQKKMPFYLPVAITEFKWWSSYITTIRAVVIWEYEIKIVKQAILYILCMMQQKFLLLLLYNFAV